MLRPSLTAIAFVALTLPAAAATYTTNTIEPFNQSLGTLQSVTVMINPPPLTTSSDTAGPFNAPGSHNHPYPTTTATLPFTTFTFSGGFTSTDGSSIPGSTHSHTIDRPAVSQTYTAGVAFNWFNNPSNATTPLVFLSSFPVFPGNEDHGHTAPPQNVTPFTRFTYEVPEPAMATTLLGALVLLRRRVGVNALRRAA